MQRRTNLLLITLLLIGLALQFAGAAQKSFWEDEAWTAEMILRSTDIPGLIRTVATRDIHPPLYTLSSFLWVQPLGLTEVSLRSLSILYIGLVMILTYKLAAETLGIRAAWFSTILLVFSPLFLMYGHNARYYAMSAFLTLLLTWCTYRFQRTSRPAYLASYIAGGAALLYVAYTTASVLVACCLWWLFEWRRQRGSPGKLLVWLLAQIVVAGLFLPWVPILGESIKAEVDLSVAVSAVDIVQRVGYLGLIFSIGETIALFNPIAWIGLAISIGVTIFATLKVGRPGSAWLPFLFLIMIEGANIVINILMADPAFQNMPHRTLYALPFFAMVLGYGMSRMRPRTGIVVGALLLGVYSVGIANYFTYRQFLKPTMQVPWHTIMGYIQQEATPDAVVVCSGGDSSCGFYAGRYGFNVARLADLRDSSTKPSQLWWIQQNIAQRHYNKQAEQDALHAVTEGYQSTSVSNYALHDPVVRRVKNTLLDERDDYDYRINLYRYSDPRTP